MKLTVISLGAGVQSSTMALMAAHGEIEPMPDCAIFADTGAEPKHVYEWLDWLETQLPFPVHRVMKRDGYTKHLEASVGGQTPRWVAAPFHTLNHGMLPRICTKEFKIEPIIKQVRELLGLKPRSPGPKHIAVQQWIGISWDEMIRMKRSNTRYIEFRWPLIEKEMRRRDCLKWMETHGYPLPRRSACVFCPYRSDDEWRALRDDHPDDWNEAVRMDALIRKGRIRGLREEIFVHRQRVPLDEVDFTTDRDRGQLDLFLDECDGMCGV